jgi:leader peptidase (prepilin peptidase)/N-methyltransferase
MSIDTLVLVCLTLLGLAVGSFLNVCIHRLPSRSSVVSPGSRCPSCGYVLGWADNIPVVSYVMLRGRCRSCKAPISLRYPIVELLTMGVFVQNFHVFGAGPILVPKLVLSCAMIVLFAIDLEHHLLPNASRSGRRGFLSRSCFRQTARVPWRSAFWSAADRSG